MGGQESNVTLNSLRRWPWAERFIILSNSIVAILLASLGVALLFGPVSLVRWSALGIGNMFFVLPSPDLFSLFVPVGPASARPIYILAAILDILSAGLLAAVAIGIAKIQRWSYWTFSVVCLSAVLVRIAGIRAFLAPNPLSHSPSAWLYVLLEIIGIAVSLAAGWYSYRRASGFPNSPAQIEKRADISLESVPWAIVVITGCALFFDCLRAAHPLHVEPWQVRYEFLRDLLFFLAYATILILAFIKSTRRLATSVAVGVSVVSILTIGGIRGEFPGSSLLLLTSIGLVAPSKPDLLAQVGFVLSNLVLIFVSVASVIRRRAIYVGCVALGAIFIGTVDPALQMLEERDKGNFARAEELAKGGPFIMFRVQSCLLRFRAAHDASGFPISLRQLDETIPGCLQSGLAKGREVGGYRIEYRASDSAPTVHFSLIAHPSIHYRGLMISFYSDETGIVHSFQGNRQAVAEDPVVTPAENFSKIERCITDFARSEDQAGHSKQSMANGAGPPHYPASFEEMNPGNRCFLEGHQDGEMWMSAAYRFEYRRVSREGIEVFTLVARPIQYGVTGLRSYLADNTFIVHATSEDRGATSDDPWASRCDFIVFVACGDDQPRTQVTSEGQSTNESPSKQESPIDHVVPPPSDAARLFWPSRTGGARFVGISPDLRRVFINVRDEQIDALSPDGKVLWYYPKGKYGLATEDSFYAVNQDGVLSRIDMDGKILWSVNDHFHGVPILSRRAVIYVFGAGGLHAISENGDTLWRMPMSTLGEVAMTWRDDEKVLYAVSDSNIAAIDVDQRKVLWSTDNRCNDAAYFCRPQLLADGSIAVVENKSYQEHSLHLLDHSGKVLWTSDYQDRIEYIVPYGTNTIVVYSNNNLYGFNSRGRVEWTWPAFWGDLSKSRNQGAFYSCYKGRQFLMDSRGERKLPLTSGNPDGCGQVHEGLNSLLFIEDRNHALWSVRLPDKESTTNVSAAR